MAYHIRNIIYSSETARQNMCDMKSRMLKTKARLTSWESMEACSGLRNTTRRKQFMWNSLA